MMYKQIECPTCGNVTTAKAIKEPQKCRWCRRLFKVTQTHVKGKKWDWNAEPVDFPEDDRFAMSMKDLSDYEVDDVYGASDSWNEEDFDGDK